MNRTAPIIRADGLLVRRSGNVVLEVETLTVPCNSTVALIGPNGAGKSTLLMCLAGLIKPDAGSVTFKGERVSHGPGGLGYRRKTAFVFQEPLLLRGTVAENIATGLKLRGESGAILDKAVSENLDRFNIAHLAGRKSGSLSGGEAQRVSLARAFAVSPELIFLDEPFSALDPPTRESLLEDLRRNLRTTGTAAVFVTHDRSEALFLADSLSVMRDGRIAQAGDPVEVMNRPVDEFVASFVGMETLVSGTVLASEGGLITVNAEGRHIEAAGEADKGSRVVLGMRPENVTIAMNAECSRTSARNTFSATIVRAVPFGPLCRVELDCGFRLNALVTAKSAHEMGLAPGKCVIAGIKATAIHIIVRS